MQDQNTRRSAVNLWKGFTSVKLTVFILLTLAITSIIGTIIPQNNPPAWYYAKYGEFFYQLFTRLDIFDMYHSFWFNFLIVLLAVNIIICSIDRLSATWKIIFTKQPRFNLKKFQDARDREQFTSDQLPGAVIESCMPVIAGMFKYCRADSTDTGQYIVAEKGRWTRLGVYIVHFSIVLLLVGSLIGSMFGFEGYVDIPEGEAGRIITLNNNTAIELDFDIRCDDFNVSFYETGQPREYRSTLTVLEKGKPVFSRDIIVNDPMHYKGISVFQSRYGLLPPDAFTLNFTSSATGMTYTIKGTFEQEIHIPENLGTVVLKEFVNSYAFHGHDLGQTVLGILSVPNGKSADIILPLKFQNFDRMRQGKVVIAIADFEKKYYTGLQVTRDPGVYLVYTGFILIILGCYITFFMPHQQLYIEAAAHEGGAAVMVAGFAGRGKASMKTMVARVAKKLAHIKANT